MEFAGGDGKFLFCSCNREMSKRRSSMLKKCLKILMGVMVFIAGYLLADERAYQKLVPEIIHLQNENDKLEREQTIS